MAGKFFNSSLGQIRGNAAPDLLQMISILASADPLLREEAMGEVDIAAGECISFSIDEARLSDKETFNEASYFFWSIVDGRTTLANIPARCERSVTMMLAPPDRLLRQEVENLYYSGQGLAQDVAQKPEFARELHQFLTNLITIQVVPASQSPFRQLQEERF